MFQSPFTDRRPFKGLPYRHRRPFKVICRSKILQTYCIDRPFSKTSKDRYSIEDPLKIFYKQKTFKSCPMDSSQKTLP